MLQIARSEGGGCVSRGGELVVHFLTYFDEKIKNDITVISFDKNKQSIDIFFYQNQRQFYKASSTISYLIEISETLISNTTFG